MQPLSILAVFGTRPEAVKMAPVLAALAADPARFALQTCVTAQHRDMLDQTLRCLGIRPDYDLDVMHRAKDLCGTAGAVLSGMRRVLSETAPDIVLVHGDTVTCLGAALAAHYHGTAVGHVEAGLRSFDMRAPFPEEANRRMVAALADLHFAPTLQARENLLREGVAEETIHVTGNTVVDALHMAQARLNTEGLRDRTARELRAIHPRLQEVVDPAGAFTRPVILVTGHRRESFGPGLERICSALAAIAIRFPGHALLYPVHLNPEVQAAVEKTLRRNAPENLVLLPPLDYLDFVLLLEQCVMVLTDSGGVQEEAASLGRPILLLRTATERPELVADKTALLVGTDPELIVAKATLLLEDAELRRRMSRPGSHYGDGAAAERIAGVLRQWAHSRRRAVARTPQNKVC